MTSQSRVRVATIGLKPLQGLKQNRPRAVKGNLDHGDDRAETLTGIETDRVQAKSIAAQSDDRAETLTGIETGLMFSQDMPENCDDRAETLTGIETGSSSLPQSCWEATIGLKPLQGLKPVTHRGDRGQLLKRDDRAETLTGIETAGFH